MILRVWLNTNMGMNKHITKSESFPALLEGTIHLRIAHTPAPFSL